MDNLTENAPAKLPLLRKAQQAQRVDRMEPDAHNAAEKAFFTRYHQYEDVLKNAANDRNTIAHPKLKEAVSDMRAALIMRKALRQHRSNEINATATRGSGERNNTETPQKALNWFYRNTWFNSASFELETAAARSIDQDIDMAGYDKNSDQYYELLSKRLRQIFPDLLIDGFKSKDAGTMIEEPKLDAFKPSVELASILVGRLGTMSQPELAKLDEVITPEVLDPLLRLLPELGELIAAIEGNKPPEVASTPSDKVQAPDKAHQWWRRNRWFNAVGYEAETAAARSIDVQLHLEGYDKNSNEYYEVLSNRLQKLFPELEVVKFN